MNPRYDKLKKLLKELFQLDQPDLDFGLYRIMHAKSGEVTAFLDNDLLPQVKQAFALYQPADKAALEQDLAQALEQARSLGVDPETTQKVKDLREKLANTAVDIASLEAEVYDHLYSFFRRYYSEGDFLSKRVYKEGVYAIPYEGEEVTLHWANKDQYYIKTSEYLRDYCIRLRPDDAANPMRVHFRLADAAEGEHGNVKAAEGKDRVFVLAATGESGHDFLSLEDGPQAPELAIRFEYRPATLTDWPAELREGKAKAPTQKDLTAFAVTRVLAVAADPFGPWIIELRKPHVTAQGDAADYSRLEGHLKRYTARNTFDYFIHKDLGTFLRRELDFYIKNEVMHLDDIENEKAPRVEQYLSKIRVIRRIAGKIIDFLAQIEDFQKKLWLKKKFVVETQWCVRVGCIPEEFYAEIAANDAQREEWVSLYAIDEIEGDLTAAGYSVPLTTQFLSAHPALVVDSRHFSAELFGRILSTITQLDDSTAGILVNGDNVAALQLFRSRFSGNVRCVYSDPPYNTGSDGFIYKDHYQHSSWLAMMASALQATMPLLRCDGHYFCSVDDNESSRLQLAISDAFPPDSFVANIAYERSGSSGVGQGGRIVNTKENILAFSLNKSTLNDVVHARPIEFETLKRYNKVLASAGNRAPHASFVAAATGEEVQIYKHDAYEIKTISLRDFESRRVEIEKAYVTDFDRVFRLTSVQRENEFQNRILSECRDGLYSADYLVSRGRYAGQRITLYYFNRQIFVWLRDSARVEGTGIIKENKITDHWSHGEIPKADLANEGGVALSRGKKPEQLLRRLIYWGTNPDEWVLDYFAGSGTTAAVACKTGRRFVTAEVEQYFDEKTVRRVKAALRGDATGVATEVDLATRGWIKIVRLESYEDTLNNLDIRRSDTQRSLLDEPAARGDGKLREQYLLKYMLDVETRGSQSLLNVAAFRDPTAYRLSVKLPGSDESREVCVDLLETFNWLIGLTVEAIAAPQVFSASFERDAENRLQLQGGRIKADASGPFWFRRVEGKLPDGRKALVVWRKLGDDQEQANLVLDFFLTDKLKISTKDFEFDVIYVNGSNNLENLKAPDDTLKVRLLEEEFHRLMFATEDV